MDRILFTSTSTFTDVSKSVKKDQDKGIRVHTSLGKRIHNFFAKFGLCSSVVAYKVPATSASSGESSGEKKTQTVYMNVASFNKWLKTHAVTDKFNPSDIKKDHLSLAIEKKIAAALKNKPPIDDSTNNTANGGSGANLEDGNPAAKPTPGADVEPIICWFDDPIVDPAAKPTAEPIVDPAAKPTAEPTAEPIAEPDGKKTAEPDAF